MPSRFDRFVRSMEKGERSGQATLAYNVLFPFTPGRAVSTPARPPSAELSRLAVLMSGVLQPKSWQGTLMARMEEVVQGLSSNGPFDGVIRLENGEGMASRVLAMQFMLDPSDKVHASATVSRCNIGVDLSGDMVLLGALTQVAAHSLDVEAGFFSCLLNIGVAVLSDSAPAQPSSEWAFSLPKFGSVREYVVWARTLTHGEADFFQAFGMVGENG